MFRRLSLDLISIPTDIMAGLNAATQLHDYFLNQVEQRRRKRTNDIIGDLVAAEIDGQKLTDDAIIAFLRLLLPAGLETTYRSSGNLLYLLLTHPEQLAMILADRTLIPAAIEEGIRYETPLTMVMRTTTEDVTVAGRTIPAGAQVDLCMGSANRDESRWVEPNTFDIRRRRAAHIAFAGGIHMCLGMHLARLETRVMLNSLFDRVTDLTLAADDDAHIVGLTFRSPNNCRSPSRRQREQPNLMRSRGAILHDVGGPWSVEEFELDPPRAGEVLVQMAAAGLCHSDDHILKGDMAAPNDVMRAMGLPTMFPTIGGHEAAGIVREVGEGVTDLAPGDHVVTSFLAVCGHCRWCATGMEYLCDAGIGTMTPGMPTDGTFRHHTAEGKPLGHISKIGAFAEYTVVSANSLVKIDANLPLAPSASVVLCDPDRLRLGR